MQGVESEMAPLCAAPPSSQDADTDCLMRDEYRAGLLLYNALLGPAPSPLPPPSRRSAPPGQCILALFLPC